MTAMTVPRRSTNRREIGLRPRNVVPGACLSDHCSHRCPENPSIVTTVSGRPDRYARRRMASGLRRVRIVGDSVGIFLVSHFWTDSDIRSIVSFRELSIPASIVDQSIDIVSLTG